MTSGQKNKTITLLLNPFYYVAGGKSLVFGLISILLAGFLGSLSFTHFGGVLDAHTNPKFSAPLWFFLSEGFINWLSLGLVLLILGKIVSKTSFRTIDLIGTQALARWPTIFVSLLCLIPGYRRFTDYLVAQLTTPGDKIEFGSADANLFCLVVLLMFLLIAWIVVLMYKSFSVSCNLKGQKAIWTFIGGLLLAEILSKYTIINLAKTLQS